MKQILTLLIAFLSFGSIYADEVKTVDVQTLKEVSKDVSTAPRYSVKITVIDTTFNSNTIIAYERLQNSRVKTNNPDGCKICISANGLKPYYIEGKDVAISEPILFNRKANGQMPAQLEHTGEYIDFTTGYRYESSSDMPQWQSGYELQQNGDDEISVICDYAMIAKWDMQPNTEYWDIPGCASDHFSSAYPFMPFIIHGVEKNKNEDLNTYYVESSDHIDFPNINCMAGWNYEDTDSSYTPDENNCYPLTRALSIGEIAPYSGFFPKEEEILYTMESAGKLYLIITPLQYDMENHIMRVNRNITIRRGSKESGITHLNVDKETQIYFTLDGRIEPNPIKGQLYILKTGSNYNKIVF